MILRKPYAFLIKKFKLIHLVLAVILGLIAYKTNDIYIFFRDYIKSSSYLKIYVEPSITSVPWYMYIMVLLAMGILIAILVLMNRKQKPTKYYLISVIFYALLIIIYVLAGSQMFALTQQQGSLKMVTLTRDLLRIFNYVQYIFVAIALLRAIGFNIKKFDFKNDLKEMNILEEDSEEFEVGIELDSNDYRTKLRRALRITKYIANENKILLIVIGGAILIYLVVTLILNVFVYNRMYRENESIKIGNYTIKVLNSYETTKSYDSTDISEKGKYIYYVVETQIKNTSKKDAKFNRDAVSLKAEEYTSYQTERKAFSYFTDIGTGYYEQVIKASATEKYLFVFKVDAEFKSNKKIFRILKNVTTEDGETVYNYANIKIKPKNLDDVEEEASVSLNQNLSIKGDLVGNFNLNIETIEFVDKVEYTYTETLNKKEYKFTGVIIPTYTDYYGKKILKMKAKLTYDEKSVSNTKIIDKFIGNFGHIRYLKNGKTYYNPFSIIERTTGVEGDEYKYFEVYDKMVDADNIWLEIVIRNKKYVYKLK